MKLCKTEVIFKNNLKRLREEKGISRYAAAAELHMDRKYYYSLESQERHINPGFEKMELLADYYGVSAADLLKDIEIKSTGEPGSPMISESGTTINWK